MKFKVPREQIPWHPSIDEDACIGCRLCFEFCKHGTYSWCEHTGKPKVTSPESCVVGCSTCAAQCPTEAISFPPLSILRQYLDR